jgi:hypothetical protein
MTSLVDGHTEARVSGRLTASPRTWCAWDFAVELDLPAPQGVALVWDFGDGHRARTTTASAVHTYAVDGQRRVSVTTEAPGRMAETTAIDIVVSGCTEGTPPLQPAVPSGSYVLIAAVVFLLLGAILVVLGIGVDHPAPSAAGAGVASGGLILFLIWAAVGTTTTPCVLTQTVHCMTFWIGVVSAPVFVLVSAWVGGVGPAFAAALAWAGLGLVLLSLRSAMARLECTRSC